VSRRRYIRGRDDMGVLPNTKDALGALDPKDVQRFLYSTTHKSHFQGRSLAAVDRSKSFLNVQQIGIRDTPYMKRQQPKVGLIRREDSGYAFDFTPKPMDQVAITKELAATFRPQRGVTAPHLSTGSLTSYAEDFVKLFDTSRPPESPVLPEHPCKAKKIMEGEPSTTLRKSSSEARLSTALGLPGLTYEPAVPMESLYVEPQCLCAGDTFRSTYRDDFDAKPSTREWRRRYRTLNGLSEFRQTAPSFGTRAKVL